MSTHNKKKYSGIFRDGGAGKLAKRRFRNRRRALMEKEKKLMVITGVPYGPGEETGWTYAYTPTYQEPAIMYLTGVNQSGVILLLDPHSSDSDEVLFVKPKDPGKEFWDGVRFGAGAPESLREARTVTGIKDIRDINEFEKVLEQRLFEQKNRRLATLWIEGIQDGRVKTLRGDHNWNFKKKLSALLRKWGIGQGALCNIMKSHFELRLPLDEYDKANTRKAHVKTAEAFKATLRRFHEFRTEYQVQGFLEGQMLMQSPYGLAFPSIIASGANATTLHYLKNDDNIGKNELVLLDFGVRWMTMHADISRTVPASGRFNPLQRMLYEIVLKAQLAVERKARMGVAIRELNEVCWGSIERNLKNEFRAVGGKYKLKYKDRPHGVSHLMGEQEHDGDPFRNYAEQPMRAGWLISNEPGLYGCFRLKHKGRVYDEEIGIRIEDDLLITEKGCINMARGNPKTVAEIEKLMSRSRSGR